VTGASSDTIEVSVPFDEGTADAVRAFFERYGSGVVEETVVCSAADDCAPAEPETWLRTYVPANDVDARLRLEIGLWQLSLTTDLPDASVRQLSEANWAEAWKAHYEPLRVGERMVISPSWREPESRDGDIVVRIDPGMAFGTGLHATTQLCLAALERLVRPGVSVLDVGTGSGVLAIGADLLGARRVVAVDIAPHAVETARQNAAANGATIEAATGQVSGLPPERFDVVVANLLAVTVIEEARQLAERVLPHATLVVSGVLADQADEVCGALAEAGLRRHRIDASGDWVAIWFRPSGHRVVPS
jgi:ribosomal protein L11 methyltransferase